MSTSADIMDRLQQQIAFLMEIDRLKHIYRQTYLLDKSRHDSDVEHSWHFAVMAMVLSEYAKDSVDVCKVMKMALIHDIVEIDAGDVFVYDRKDSGDHYALEQAAAKRIFGMLPADQAKEYIALWEEFEARETPEAKFAAALDRLDPLLHNYYTEGRSWREHGVTADQSPGDQQSHRPRGTGALGAGARACPGLRREGVPGTGQWQSC